MPPLQLSGATVQNFVDALETADDEAALRLTADRLIKDTEFRWFAYLGFSGSNLEILASYPAPWIQHYLGQGYEQIDPVIKAAKSAQRLFYWDGLTIAAKTPVERRLFHEASRFGIRCGITVPIRGGFGRFASLTFASDEIEGVKAYSTPEALDTLQLLAFYFHIHIYAKLQTKLNRAEDVFLTQRERQCLWWTAHGKAMPEIAAILGVSKRTIAFHFENARTKLGSATITQAVAEALLRRLIMP